VGGGPGGQGILFKKDADRKGGFPVGSDIEDILYGSGTDVAGSSRTATYEVVLVDVALGSDIGF
jgi:hypothetical protein